MATPWCSCRRWRADEPLPATGLAAGAAAAAPRAAADHLGPAQPVASALCAHRVGALAIGDLAVWVGVSSAHRDAAFQASRFIIDEIKHRLPIWKKEYYVDGDSGWVNCEACAAHAHSPSAAAHRHGR